MTILRLMGPETEPEEQTQNPSTSFLPIYSVPKLNLAHCFVIRHGWSDEIVDESPEPKLENTVV